jgi:hypothetical protein
MVVCRCEEVRLETGPTPLAPLVSCRTVETLGHGRPGRAHGRDARATNCCANNSPKIDNAVFGGDQAANRASRTVFGSSMGRKQWLGYK